MGASNLQPGITTEVDCALTEDSHHYSRFVVPSYSLLSTGQGDPSVAAEIG